MRNKGKFQRGISRPNKNVMLSTCLKSFLEHRDQLARKYKARVFDFIAKVSLLKIKKNSIKLFDYRCQ